MKKFIIHGFIFLTISSLFIGYLPRQAFAFLGFGEGGNASTLDCDETLEKITKGNEVVGEWGTNPVGGYKYITDKKVLNRQDGGYCYLYRGQSEDANEAGQSTGQYNNEEEIKIFYFTNLNSAIAKLQELKNGERGDFKMKNSDELSYSGHTESEGQGFFGENGEPNQYSVDIPNYARTVRALGNCLIEVKYFDHMDRHGWSFKTRENFIWQVAEWYNGITEGFDKVISTSEDILTFCGAKSSGLSTVQTKQAKPTPQLTTKQAPGPFGIFGINPYETWLNLQSLLYLRSSLFTEDTEMLALNITGNKAAFDRIQENRAIKEGAKENDNTDKEQKNIKRSEVSSQELKNLGVYASVDELLNRTPQITEEIIKKAQEEWEKLTDSTKRSVSPYSIDILNGQAQIKYPNENEWRDVKAGDKIPPGSTIFTGMDTTTVLTIESKGVVQIAPFSEVTINESGLEQATLNKTMFTDIELRTGEIELDVKGPTFGPSFQVFTTNAVAGVRGTHFWVSYDKNKKLSTVGVYKGQVEVKSSGSNKSILISPNGDKPGIAVISQKLSIIKLAPAGLVLVAVVGGAFMILKRKFTAKGSNKKKK